MKIALSLLIGLFAASIFAGEEGSGFTPLFPKDGVPQGWSVRAWDDVKNKPKETVVWKVENGILNAGEPRGTWLVSDKEYGDFILEFEFKLGERGNSGCGDRKSVV